MRILAIETTGPYCSVALLDGEEIYAETSTARMNHLKTLTPMINDLMEEHDCTFQDLDYIAASVGPGSFTGIRIGVSTARALSQISGVPCIAVPTLDAFAFGKSREEIVCPTFDARRSQVYAGAYYNKLPLVEGGPYMLDEFLTLLETANTPVAAETEEAALVRRKLIFIGDGLKPYGDRIMLWANSTHQEVECSDEYQNAEAVALYAAELLKDGNATICNYEELKPNYMRMAEAERNLRDGKI